MTGVHFGNFSMDRKNNFSETRIYFSVKILEEWENFNFVKKDLLN